MSVFEFEYVLIEKMNLFCLEKLRRTADFRANLRRRCRSRVGYLVSWHRLKY
jgi:hypothetical protein